MPNTPRLTPRERQIVRALLAGRTNREIGQKLGLREQTVKNQLSVIYGKLGVRNRVELALQAERDRSLDREEER
jgi:two-component system, NarL family, nitrate/nitrite response regulator NarL